MVLHEEDGGVGVLGAQLLHAAHHAVEDEGHLVLGEVGQAVEDEELGVYLVDIVEHLGLEHAVAGEGEVDEGIACLSLHDIGPRHAGARGAGSLADGGAIDNDGSLLGDGHQAQVVVVVHAYLHPLDLIVEGQEQLIVVAAALAGEVGEVAELIVDGVLEGDIEARGAPAQLAVGVGGVEVEARHAGGGHVEHVESAGHPVAHADGGGVGAELDGESCGLLREAPHG